MNVKVINTRDEDLIANAGLVRDNAEEVLAELLTEIEVHIHYNKIKKAANVADEALDVMRKLAAELHQAARMAK